MTTAAPERIRRSVRFARLDAQAGAAVRTAPQRRERFSGTGKLETLSLRHSQDWTSGAGVSPSGRFQVVESPRARQKAFGPKGIRADAARVLLWILIAVLSVLLLVRFASIGASEAQIRRLETRITAAEGKQKELRDRLTATGGDISVCTRAVELNLISSGGAPTIQLTAPEGATMNLMTEASATAQPELRASARASE